jgi:hypothetical protein
MYFSVCSLGISGGPRMLNTPSELLDADLSEACLEGKRRNSGSPSAAAVVLAFPRGLKVVLGSISILGWKDKVWVCSATAD